ncbi:MAG: pyridoxal-phosphate dependent enzyme [Planctomycetaceae bacterium]|nr:pyridoxal-phosphate dependent enzyme [Planctomycetaceae bacterium]
MPLSPNRSPSLPPLPARFPLAHLPTAVEPMDRLGAHLGLRSGQLWVKRDDQTGLALGGNKARKLEFLVADALRRGADTLVVGGGAQSNNVRATAAAGARAGLKTVAVLGGPEPEHASGNLLLDRLLGCEVEWLDGYEFAAVEARIEALCAELAAGGAHPYRVPIGASTALGALGYSVCAEEIAAEVPAASTVVLATGSAGTHAGLLAGFASLGGDGWQPPRVLGVDVGARPHVTDAVDTLAAAAARLLGAATPSPARVLSGQVGEGYGAPTAAAAEALRLAARLEGLILDPVYTAKALAGLIAALRAGELDGSGPILFLHTGGAPGLFDPRWSTFVG